MVFVLCVYSKENTVLRGSIKPQMVSVICVCFVCLQ